jgi:hypothetical protein
VVVEKKVLSCHPLVYRCSVARRDRIKVLLNGRERVRAGDGVGGRSSHSQRAYDRCGADGKNLGAQGLDHGSFQKQARKLHIELGLRCIYLQNCC